MGVNGEEEVQPSGSISVSSVGTDRASNHGNSIRPPATQSNNNNNAQQQSNVPLSTSPPAPSMLPVPTTVVAINVGDAEILNDASSREGDLGGVSAAATTSANTVKLTAEALAKNDDALANNSNGIDINGGQGMYGIMEMSSTLSRSSSESGLKNVYKGANSIPSQVKVVPIKECGGENDSGAATPAHFQPWEASSVTSSLGDGSLHAVMAGVEPDAPVEGAAVEDNAKGLGESRALSQMTLDVRPSLSSETPPKANLSSTKFGDTTVAEPSLPPLPNTPSRTPSKAIPVLHSVTTPEALLPMRENVSVLVDSTIASTLPPAPPGSKSIPNSPMPPSAFRGQASVTASPAINRNNSKKATFLEPVTLTRTSSNGSSNTTATNASVAKRIRLGVCAMDKKARSKPMSEILNRLNPETFEPVFFGDAVILNEPVENWPVCDVLIAFYSNGYPLEKAEKYVTLRQPYLLNDLKMQRVLMDRRRVYDLLEESGIDVPRHVFMSRDGYVSTGTGDGRKSEDTDGGNACNEEPDIEEHDDHIEVNGVVIHKPFVEKPIDADDHNIAIYYPSSAGGGCKKLFRKVGDRSSEFYPEINEIRRDGSYIYEEFIETQGTDVKMCESRSSFLV